MTTSGPAISDDSVRFPSLQSLRAAHTELLKEFRMAGSTPEMNAKIEAFIRRGKATGALLDADADRWAAQSQLDYWGTQLYRPDYEPPDATLNEFDPQLAPELPDELCPYLGLDAFRERNQSVFFGRMHLVQELIRKLQNVRFLAVVGSSGSGKSSVVRAGLISALKSGALPGSADWTYFTPMVPGSNPLMNLARLLLPPEVNAAQLEQEAGLYRQSPAYLAKIVSEQIRDDGVLVVDQFEEIFTLCTDDIARQRFVENLIGLCRVTAAEHRVIITLRSDFETNIAKLSDLHAIFEQSAVRVTPLSAAELRESIEAPAAKIGLKFEEGVVNALLNDTLGEPAALPLLQFTLLKLWENRERNRITWEAYKRLGGGRQALARSADDFYNGLIHEDQVAMRRILLRMVRPGEGLEVHSNRVRRSALYHKAEASDRIDRVLNKLIQARLVRISEGDMAADEQVEVAHEALVRNWPRLVAWLEEERGALRQRQGLTKAAEEWQRLQRDPSALWNGVQLEEARDYDDLSPLEAEFLKASQEAEQTEINKLHARTTQLRRLALTLTGALLVALIAIFVATYSGTQALKNANLASQQAATAQAASTLVKAQQVVAQANADVAQANALEARRLAAISRASELAAQSAIVRDKDFRDSLLLGVEAFRTFDTYQTRGTIMDNIQTNPQLQRYISSHTGSVNSVAFSPDGGTLATAGCRELDAHDDCLRSEILLRDVISGERIGQPIVRDTGSIYFVVFSPDGTTLASVGCEELEERDASIYCVRDEILLWDALSGQPIGQPLNGHTGFVSSVVFSPDGKILASASCREIDSNNNCIRGEIILWDVVSGQLIGQPFIGHNSFVGSLVFTPDGRTLASVGCGELSELDLFGSCTQSELLLWDVATGQSASRPLSGHLNDLASFTFSPNGATLAALGCGELAELDNFGNCSRESILLWDVVSGQPIGQPLIGYTGSIGSLAFSPGGERLASGSTDNTIMLWDVFSGQPIGQSLTGHTDSVISVAFGPDPLMLVSSASDGTVIVWELSQRGEHQLIIQRFYGYDLTFSPDGQTVAAGLQDKRIILWNLETGPEDGQALGKRTQTDRGFVTFVIDIVFSPNGKMVMWGTVDGEVFLWNIETNRSIPLNLPVDVVTSVTFSPDGKLLALGSEDGTILLWDIETGQPIGEPLSGHRRSVRTVTFSPDGKILASGGSDAKIIFWNVETRQMIGQPLSGHRDLITSVIFSPDGETLASSARSDNSIILWDVATQQPIGQPLRGHRRGVNSLAFSPDGTILVSGGGDNKIILWDVETRRPIGQPLRWIVTLDEDEDEDSIFSVTFSPDGRMLASSSLRGSRPILWDVDPQAWIERTCQRAGHNFTREEWAYYFPNEEYRKTCEQWPLEPEFVETPSATP